MNISAETTNINEFNSVVAKFLEQLVPVAGSATVIALTGELGSGKTTFSKELARLLGITEPVTSPTFTIAQFYRDFKHDYFQQLIHIDAYRLEQKSELDTLGFSEWIADTKNLILIEWPNQVGIDSSVIDYDIQIEHGVAGEQRKITIQ